jgi:hypothetical protein
VSAARVGRTAAGVAVLIGLLGFGALLAPVYYRNYQFSQSLSDLVVDSDVVKQSDEALRAAVVDRAAQFGLKVHSDQVRLGRRDRRLRIEVRYKVPVDMSLYTVDLHFRPSAAR